MAMASAPSEVFQNINISAYRVLFILLMLVRYRSLNMVELNRLLYENPMIGRGYNSETLTKYINTLREVGCRIPRSTNRNDYSYELLRNPFPVSLDAKELSAARKLLDVLASQPDEVLYQDYRRFMEGLAWAVGSNASLEWEEEPGLVPVTPLRDVGLWRQRFNEFKRYCQEAFALEIQYADPEHGEQALSIEPYEVLERGTRLLLLDLDRVASVRQLPSKNRRPPVQVTVVFALYGRLAKSYRLYPDERLVYSSDTEIQVKTRLTETTGLMLRLLKYGASCQVLSPDGLRDTMREHIAGLLSVMEGQAPAGVSL